jgi:hypothetical protein
MLHIHKQRVGLRGDLEVGRRRERGKVSRQGIPILFVRIPLLISIRLQREFKIEQGTHAL